MKGNTTVAITRQVEQATPATAGRPAHPLRRLAAQLSRLEWWFVGALIIAYCFIMQPPGTNTISRWDMVWALAHGTAIIDAHAANTIDVSYFAGHYYSPRSLGPSLLAVPVYWGVHGVAAVLHRQVSMVFDLYVMNLLTTVPACIIAALLFARFVARLRPALAGTPLPLVAASAFALGTLFFPFSMEFFGHALGGSLAFIAFYLLYRARASPRRRQLILAAGVLAGYAVISEYLLAVVALMLCGYVWATAPMQERWQLLALFVAGTLPSAALLGWYNWFAFGSPLHMSYGYVTGAKFAGQHTGLFGVTLPSLGGLVEIVAWPRGLLVESPFLLFLPLGFVRWWRSGRSRRSANSASFTGSGTAGGSATSTSSDWRHPPAEAVVCALIAVVYPLLVASYFLPFAGENMPGPRLLVPMLPFACLALAWVVDEPRRWLRGSFVVLLAVGFALSALYVLLGVREDHTYLTYPVTGLFIPVLTTGLVPVLNGPTIQSLGTKLLKLPVLASQYVYLVLFAAWCGYMLYALLRQGGSGTLAHLPQGRRGQVDGVASCEGAEVVPVADKTQHAPGG